MKSVDQKRPLKVFLCHARNDQIRVRDLYNRLTKDGVDVWLDKVSLLPGQAWEYEIRKAVREADVVVVCLSAQFNQAGFRQKEVRLALDTAMEKPEGEIFIIPARLEECESLESLRQWHWVDLFEADGYETLMRALRARADNIGATLQLKKWLPSFTTPRKTEPRPDKAPDAVGIGGDVKESVIVSGSGNVINIGTQETPAPKLTATQPEPKKISPRKPNTTVIVALIGLVGTLISSLVWIKILFPTLPTEIMDTHNTIMRLVPAGEFTMGSKNGDPDEVPIHNLYLDSFFIDKYEISNLMYKKCVDQSVCIPPKSVSSYSHLNYYGNSEFDNYPIINVTWNMAKTYCTWRGARLPTEAEWEKAARGTDTREYPWGISILGYGNLVNFCDDRCEFEWHDTRYDDGYEDISPVSLFIGGVSPYGVYNMSGNVWEWVSTLYKPYPYNSNDGRENLLSTDARVLRGGSAGDYLPGVRISQRESIVPPDTHYHVGFRCAKDATP